MATKFDAFESIPGEDGEDTFAEGKDCSMVNIGECSEVTRQLMDS